MERIFDRMCFPETAQSLIHLYEDLPPVSCTSCGKCCASPHITFAEAMHLFAWLFDTHPAEDLERMFNAETVEQKFAFNFKCRFEDPTTRLCGVHPARGFICRVFGYPVLDRMGIAHMDNCHEPDRPVIPDVRLGRMHGWLDRLARLNLEHTPSFNRPPYFVTGLNIETWLDIAVTDYGRRPFDVYHRRLNHLPFSELHLTFSDRTHLSTRLAKIDLFHQARIGGRREESLRLIQNLLNSEPMTGSFFRFEAHRHATRQNGELKHRTPLPASPSKGEGKLNSSVA